MYRGLGLEDWDNTFVETVKARVGFNLTKALREISSILQRDDFQRKLFVVENDVDDDTSCPIRDIEVCPRCYLSP